MRDSIFVSYSHQDQAWLDALPWPADIRREVWIDTRIAPGDRWEKEIQEAISTAAGAVLLLSPAFFASDFIRTRELPVLLEAAHAGHVRLFPVILTACDKADLRIVTQTFQALNPPGQPLATMEPEARNRVWSLLAQSLSELAVTINDETRIAAEMTRLKRDVAERPEVAHADDKMARAKVDPVFNEDERMRENTLLFLTGERISAAVTWLLEESTRTDLAVARRKAVVRLMEEYGQQNERVLGRVTSLTQEFAADALSQLKEAKAAALNAQTSSASATDPA